MLVASIMRVVIGSRIVTYLERRVLFYLYCFPKSPRLVVGQPSPYLPLHCKPSRSNVALTINGGLPHKEGSPPNLFCGNGF